MGKRSSFERVPRDFYPTPAEAVKPLLPHLGGPVKFVEPCVGAGDLVRHLERAGHRCTYSCDIDPNSETVRDARMAEFVGDFDCIITNPPWDRQMLHPIISNLARQKPTWLLFDADWMHTRQANPYLPLLRKIVSVGRVKWIADSPFTGKDNCCWYLFDSSAKSPAHFIGRAA